MKNIYIILFFALGIITIINCKKDEDLTKDLKGGPSLFEYTFTDTLSLFTQTISEDSIRTSGTQTANGFGSKLCLVGKMNDPLMGETSSNAYFDINLSELDKVLNNGSNHVDSAVMIINLQEKISGDVNNNYGNTQSPQYLELFELNTKFEDSSYYSNSSIPTNLNPIAYYNGKVNTTDNVFLRTDIANTEEYGPSLKFKLSSGFAQKLFSAGAADLKSQETFKAYIKGFSLKPSNGSRAPNEGAIYALNISSSTSKVRLFYNDSLYTDFPMGVNSHRFSEYKSISKSSTLTKHLSSSYNADTCFSQAMRICKTKVQIPHLFSLLDLGKIAIHKAVIEVNTINFSNNSYFPFPSDMFIFKSSPLNNKNISLVEHFGIGHVDNFNIDNNKKYQFVITNELQEILVAKQENNIDNNSGFYLNIPADQPIQPARIMFDTRKNVPEGIKLLVWYTKL